MVTITCVSKAQLMIQINLCISVVCNHWNYFEIKGCWVPTSYFNSNYSLRFILYYSVLGKVAQRKGWSTGVIRVIVYHITNYRYYLNYIKLNVLNVFANLPNVSMAKVN